jgi:hypothetical protein
MSGGIDGTRDKGSCFLATLTTPLWLMSSSPNQLLLGNRIMYLSLLTSCENSGKVTSGEDGVLCWTEILTN